MVGSKIGLYEIVDEIGRGGMGIVYKAWDTRLARYVALKVLPPEFTYDSQFVERFMEEAQRMAQLDDHPHIVTVHDVGEENGCYYFAMQFVDGTDLATILRQVGRLDLGRAITLTNQIASALDHAHTRGIIHRDVKPENILIDREGRVRVTDFGIAKALAGPSRTRTGMMVGTPEYMSPEQAQGRELDRRADVYSLGIVLYQMLTGDVPFRTDSAVATALQHVSTPPPPLRERNADLPEYAERVVLKALEKDPANRFHTAGELAAALAGQTTTIPPIAQPTSTRTPPGPLPTAPPGAIPRPKERSKLVAVVLISLASLLGMALIALALISGRTQKGLPPTPLVRPQIAMLPPGKMPTGALRDSYGQIVASKWVHFRNKLRRYTPRL